MKLPRINNIESVQLGVIHFLRLTLLLAILSAIWGKRWTVLFAGSLILLTTYIPYFFEKKYHLNLPVEFEFIIILFLYTSLFLGELQSYYTKFWWWDIVLHTGSSMALGFVGFLILHTLYYQEKIKAAPHWIAIFAFSFGLGLGALWEIFEFGADKFLGLNMQKSGLVDTMWDLIVDALGALTVSLFGYYYLKGKKKSLFAKLLEKFVKENPHHYH